MQEKPLDATIPVPRSLEEAFRAYPNAEENVRRYEQYISRYGQNTMPQLRVAVDDEIRMTVEVDDCMGGRVSSGYVSTEIIYHPVPDSGSEMWVDHVKIFDSNLSGGDLDLFMACFQSKVMHRRQPIKSERFAAGRSSNYVFAWPVEQSNVFLFLQTGNWPGQAPTP